MKVKSWDIAYAHVAALLGERPLTSGVLHDDTVTILRMAGRDG